MKTRNIILSFIAILTFSSCQDMFEPADENNRQLEDMVHESAYAHGLLMSAYSRLPYQTTTTTDIATDDAVTNQKTSGYLAMATGSWASNSNPMSQWDACNDGIQYANLFLEIVEKVNWAQSAKSKQQMFIDRLKGEAFGIRAILLMNLLQAHAGYADDGILYGVPLHKSSEDASSDFNKSRNTFAECINQIFDDCDSAMANLPFEYADVSKTSEIPEKYLGLDAQITGYNLVFGTNSQNLMSAKIAEAVKAQAALLAASPAFRDQSGVTSERAAELCANVLKRIGGLSGLDKTGNIWYKNKTAIEGKAEIPEILWRFDKSSNDANQERDNFPPTILGSGRVNPSQNLVDAFPMRSGRPITDPASKYDPNNPYANRDPRLADAVIYNGMTIRQSEIITGTYLNKKKEASDNLNNNSSSTRTGYYMRKLLREDVNAASSGTGQVHIYPRIRYTEIFLAFAEAANDAWDDPKDARLGFSAYDVIKAIRERAGLGTNEVGMKLPEGDAYLEECAADKAKMAELIRNERRLELCFENKRFWDIRRWKLDKALTEPIRGVKWEMKDNVAVPNYESSDINPVEERVYDPKYQFYGPIPNGEILKWSNLKQNKGWD